MAASEWGLPHAPHAVCQETPPRDIKASRHRAPDHLSAFKRDKSPLQQADDNCEAVDRTSDQSGQVGTDTPRVVLPTTGGRLPIHLRDGTRETAGLTAEENQREGLCPLHQHHCLGGSRKAFVHINVAV